MSPLACALLLLGCEAPGAPEDPEEPSSADADIVEPTWSNRIADIVQRNCVRCHASGRFSTYAPLQTYAQVLRQQPLLLGKLGSPPLWGTQMPPFPAGEVDGCTPTHDYTNDLRLSPDDLAAMLAWIDSGMPEGEPSDGDELLVAPAPARLPDVTEYPFEDGYVMSIGESDDDGHRDDWVCVVVDPGTSATSRFMSGLQINPDQQQVFRGAVVWLDRSRASRAFLGPSSPRQHGDSWYDCDDGFGFDGEILGGFLPEGEPIAWPPGTAVEIPGDALFVVRIHYHGHYDQVDPQDTTPLPPVIEWPDHTSLSVQWADPAAIAEALMLSIGNYEVPATSGTGNATHPFQIPQSGPESAPSLESMVAVVPGDSSQLYALWAVHPEMGEAGRIVTVFAGDPGAETCVAAAPRWDTSWQLPLTFDTVAGAAPTVRGGQRIRVDCQYLNRSNSALTLDEESCRAMVGLVPITAE